MLLLLLLLQYTSRAAQLYRQQLEKEAAKYTCVLMLPHWGCMLKGSGYFCDNGCHTCSYQDLYPSLMCMCMRLCCQAACCWRALC